MKEVVGMSEYKGIKNNGVKIDEHRMIMEKHLGRKLSFDEVVHHINGDKNDNRIENLEVMNRGDHSRLHLTGRVFSEDTKRKIGKTSKRDNPNCRKLSNEDVLYIRNNYCAGDPDNGCRALSRKYGVTHSVIQQILQGKTYKNIDQH